MINKHIIEAYKILDGEMISEELAVNISKIQGNDILDLVSLANKVRNKFTPGFHICSIMNCKSGECFNDCKFCSQSKHHKSEIEIYPFVKKEKIIKEIEKVYEQGIKNFGFVTSGYGYKKIDSEFENIIKIIKEVNREYPDINICASFGILSDETAKALSKCKIYNYNHNIQVNPEKFEKLISTIQNINDRINTIKYLKKYDIGTCVGGIIGVGETMEDRVKMAFSLKELDVDVIPINVLVPIKGTALENQAHIHCSEIAKTFAIFKLINPTKIIKFAAGRETQMKDFQGLLMLSGANGMLTGGYLTTRGRTYDQDKKFINELENFYVQ